MIKKIINLIIDAAQNEDATLLRAALNILKNEFNLEELKGDNYSRLVSISHLVKDDSLKALLIETIVESPDYTRNGSRLLEEYVQQLSKGTTTVEAAARCLGAFTASGYSNNEIFLQIAENVDHEFGIEILVTMGRSNWGEVPSHLESFAMRVQKEQRIRYRSSIFGAFLLIVHPLLSKYAHVSSLSFGYPSIEAAMNDWAWVTQKSTETLIERKIITTREAEVLVKLGSLLHKIRNLSPLEAKELYTDFFGNKNPFDVIYTLPED